MQDTMTTSCIGIRKRNLNEFPNYFWLTRCWLWQRWANQNGISHGF